MGKSFFFGVIISAAMSLWAGDPITDEAIVKEYLTPYKLGKPILAPSGVEGEFDQLAVDHPRVFVHNDRVYLMYIGYDGISYQTALAVSDDMLHWQKLGIVFKRNASTNLWDKTGRAISGFLRNVNLWEPPTLTKKDGKYWLFYHAYPSKGYEGGAAANGIAWTTDESFLNWTCADKPILEKSPDKNSWDGAGLYSVWCVPRDGTYWLYYNGKDLPHWPWHEQVGVCFAEDDSLMKWKRYEHNPVCKVGDVGWNKNFTCGQSILWDAKKKCWMRWFCGFDGCHAQNGVAISRDGLDWQTFVKPVIPVGKPGEIDAIHAHKGEYIYFKGALWQFYCAVRPLHNDEERKKFKKKGWNEFRCLTIARSTPFTEEEMSSVKQ